MTGAPDRKPPGPLPDPPLVGHPVLAPPLPGRPYVDQHWADLTFVHWPVDPGGVAHLYPPGTRPDIFADGLTYAGLVAFAIRRTALGALPVPYFGAFAETNVRLYSVDDAGHRGVMFRSLETPRLAVVPLIRAALGVPYTWAKMRVHRSQHLVSYDSVRRWPRRGLRSRLAVRVGEEVTPDPLEVWLTARWGAHTRRAGRTWWVPTEHVTWPFRAAEVVTFEDDLVAAGGVKPAGDRLRALFCSGIRARFGRPCAVG